MDTKAGPKPKALPPGQLTLIVRQAMKDYNGAAFRQEAAKKTGLTQATYTFIRKLIILVENEQIPWDRRNQMRRVLRKIDEERNIQEARDLIEDTVNEFWAHHTTDGFTRRDRASHRKQKQILENTLFQIRNACDNNDDLAIPGLTQEERAQAIETLTKSIAALTVMITRVNAQQLRKEKEKVDHDIKDSGGLQDPIHPGEEPVRRVGKVAASLQ